MLQQLCPLLSQRETAVGAGLEQQDCRILLPLELVLGM